MDIKRVELTEEERIACIPSKAELEAYLATPDDEIAANLRQELPDKTFKNVGFFTLYSDNIERAAINKVLSMLEPVELEAIKKEAKNEMP